MFSNDDEYIMQFILALSEMVSLLTRAYCIRNRVLRKKRKNGKKTPVSNVCFISDGFAHGFFPHLRLNVYRKEAWTFFPPPFVPVEGKSTPAQ